jgi:hypothetical protein
LTATDIAIYLTEGVASGTGYQQMIYQTIYLVTCGLCGQTWLQMEAQEGQMLDCLFCGSHGVLRLGLRAEDRNGFGWSYRVKTMLDCTEASNQ